MVTAAQVHDLTQQVGEDRVRGLRSEHWVLYQHKERPHFVLVVQADQQNTTMLGSLHDFYVGNLYIV